MMFHKDQCLVPYSSYTISTILTKLLYIAMYTTLQMTQIFSTFINLTGNKISLNASKTDIVISKHKQTIITKHMNVRVSGKKINATKNLIPNFNMAIGLLFKVRHYMPKFLLKTIYYSFFNSHLIYASQIWGQIKTKLFQEVMKLQNKALRIINFLPFNSSNINKTYNDLKVLKLPDFISLQNSLFVKDCFEKEIPNPFINYFQKSGSQHSHRTRSAFKNCAFVPNVNTDIYRKKSININASIHWKKYQKQLKINLSNRRLPHVKKSIKVNFLKSYLER